jgi:YHS domain-containing protein
MATTNDPVCGMLVDTATAPERIVHGDHMHYFCSAECRSRFQADPRGYHDRQVAMSAGGRDFEPERHEPPFTTAGGITAPKFGSAGSGGLEYEPLPERHVDRQDAGDGDDADERRMR